MEDAVDSKKKDVTVGPGRMRACLFDFLVLPLDEAERCKLLASVLDELPPECLPKLLNNAQNNPRLHVPSRKQAAVAATVDLDQKPAVCRWTNSLSRPLWLQVLAHLDIPDMLVGIERTCRSWRYLSMYCGWPSVIVPSAREMAEVRSAVELFVFGFFFPRLSDFSVCVQRESGRASQIKYVYKLTNGSWQVDIEQMRSDPQAVSVLRVFLGFICFVLHSNNLFVFFASMCFLVILFHLFRSSFDCNLFVFFASMWLMALTFVFCFLLQRILGAADSRAKWSEIRRRLHTRLQPSTVTCVTG